MKRYTLKVSNDNSGQIENIWTGNDMSKAIHYEAKAIEYWGKENVWICDNLQDIIAV